MNRIALARTHDIRNISYELEVKSRYYASTDNNILYPQQMRKCNDDASSEMVPKRVDFVQNNRSPEQKNERENNMNTSSYPNNCYNGKVMNAVYNVDHNDVALRQPETDCENEYYNDDGNWYTQQPYVVVRESKDKFKFGGEKHRFKYFWTLYNKKHLKRSRQCYCLNLKSQ